jgi:hypothetical protein
VSPSENQQATAAAGVRGAQVPARASEVITRAVALGAAAVALYGAWRASAPYAAVLCALATGYAGLVGLGIVLAAFHRRTDPGTARYHRRTSGTARTLAEIGADIPDKIAMWSMEAVQLTALALPWLAAALYGGLRLLSG